VFEEESKVKDRIIKLTNEKISKNIENHNNKRRRKTLTGNPTLLSQSRLLKFLSAAYAAAALMRNFLSALFLTLSSVTCMRTTTSTGGIVITLEFDGSFRPPRDFGFSPIPHRQAVCAACIEHRKGSDAAGVAASTTPLAVGSKILPVGIAMSSQHTEYEGLLLGLKYINDNRCILTANDNQTVELTIQGDCKTVIDQLSGKAVPRKLEALHSQASCLIRTISSNEGLPVTISYRHISRNDNLVSDNLCRNLMDVMAIQRWKRVAREIDTAKTVKRSLSKQHTSTVKDILEKNLDPSTSNIRYSMRPPLYDKLAAFAFDTEDYETPIAIGEQLVEEVKRFHPMEHTVATDNQAYASRNELTRRGLCYQIQGWKGLGKMRKAEFLERKHRHLLSSGSPVHTIDTTKTMQVEPKPEWDSRIPTKWKDILQRWFDVVMTEFGINDDEESNCYVWVVQDKQHLP
jgi:hypothetical protein